jgi:alpha-glucosidase
MIPFKSKIQIPVQTLIRDLTKTKPVIKPITGLKLGRFLSYDVLPQGAIMFFENAELEVKFITEAIVRLTWSPGKLPIPYALSEEFINEKTNAVETQVLETDLNLSISSNLLQVFVSNLGEVKYLDMHGNVVRIENPPEQFGTAWQQSAPIQKKQLFSGLGGATAINSLRGGCYTLWNTDPGGSYTIGTNPLNYHHPTIFSVSENGNYLIFYENTFRGLVKIDTDDAKDKIVVEFEDGALRYYVMAGTPDEIMLHFTELTGRHELPPRWALGYHQSRWGYRTSDEIREVAKQFEEHELPLDVLHFDIDYMDEYRIFTNSPERYPDFSELIDELHQKGISVVTIIDPAVKVDKNFSVYQSGVEKDVFCKTPKGKELHALVWPGKAAFPDFTNPITRKWWGDQYDFYLDAAVDGFWHDMNEPAAFYTHGDASIDIGTLHNLEGTEGTHEEAHNVYGLLMNRAAYEGLKQKTPSKRPWMLTRSGWTGAQKYTWNWTGDIGSSWDTLKLTISMMIHHSLSGMAYTGADVGGFSSHPSDELFIRWFQMSVFLPFFRVHSCWGLPHREPYHYSEPILGYFRKSLLLREQLIPYFYTLAYQNHLYGTPLIRPIYWDDPQNELLWNESESFMLGNALLVSPIVKENAIKKTVLLPNGHWYDYWSDELYQGCGEFEILAKEDVIPVFVKAGSVLPMKQDGTIHLHIYPQLEGIGGGMFYDDAGDGYGSYHMENYKLHWEASQIVLTKTINNTGFAKPKNYPIHFHGLKIARIWVDEKPRSIEVVDNTFEIDDFSRVRIEFKI